MPVFEIPPMTVDRTAELSALLAHRILILDGAMGTMIQGYHLQEEDFRGMRFQDWPCDLKGNNDLLVLTQPAIIQEIHAAYLDAGADIIETNTFNSTAISMHDYGMESLVPELNREAARLAREVADRYSSPERPRFVAGIDDPATAVVIDHPVGDLVVEDVDARQDGGLDGGAFAVVGGDGDLGDLATVCLEDDRGLVLGGGADVLVQAVGGGVQFAIVKPFVERRIGLVQHPGERLVPDHVVLGKPAPEAAGILVCLGTERVIRVHARNTRGLDHGIRGRKNAVLSQHGLDRRR